MGQMGGSDGSWVKGVTFWIGQMYHELVGQTGHFSDGLDGSWVMHQMGHFLDGSHRSWVSWSNGSLFGWVT